MYTYLFIMISICGFNGFRQVSSLDSYVHKKLSNKVESSLKEFHIIPLRDFLCGHIIISWSYIVVHSGTVSNACLQGLFFKQYMLLLDAYERNTV